jgi:hypothetical protein
MLQQCSPCTDQDSTSLAEQTQDAPAAASCGRVRWWLALGGQFAFVLAVAALSGPGRIDIVDGQTRYEVARSLVDHGDFIVRNPYAWFGVYRGRGGELYTSYRIPQTALGVVAIAAADATGPVDEMRRHFFFVLTGAVAGAVLAVTYSVWFRGLGYGPAASLAWGTAGFFCTPSWYYATSSYDDILGTAAVVLALAVAWLSRERRPLLGGAAAGLLLGWAIHCKPPLGFFVLPVLVAGFSAPHPWRRRVTQFALVWLGIAVGLAGYKVYEDYKFPAGTTNPAEQAVKQYGPSWTADPLPGLASMALSPSCGALWYCPPLLLACYGWASWRRTRPWFCASVLAASALFVLFVAFLSFFKGEPCWGPRYLTPVFAVWWVFVPASVGVLRRALVATLLALGVLVQLLGLSIDSQRLFLKDALPIEYYRTAPWFTFDVRIAHLFQRPRELWQVLSPNPKKIGTDHLGPLPTHAAGHASIVPVGITSLIGRLPAPGVSGALSAACDFAPSSVLRTIEWHEWAADHYLVYRSLRPWWAWQWSLPPEERPVDLDKTLWFLVAVSLLGLGLVVSAVGYPVGRDLKRAA